ncbi:Transcription factor elt-7 [Caenorhabditis elegans]|nr:Transcription factor elt-7 [Caenorhabditis elegans]CCD65231.1 Transcription factor elt-7 [Caenorhabditis elegans]|eukprot:NP_001122856.1 Transcription factor elt-7 [Caenorhabditis elegans]
MCTTPLQPLEDSRIIFDESLTKNENEQKSFVEQDSSYESSGNRFGSQKGKKIAKVIRDACCSHCSTTTTTLWRKNDEGNLECNACNLYYRHNKVKRPLSLCKQKPTTRKRRQAKKE